LFNIKHNNRIDASEISPNIIHERLSYILLNQEQLEITLPSCILYLQGSRIENEGTANEIIIYTYSAHIISKDKIVYAFDYFNKYGSTYNHKLDKHNIGDIPIDPVNEFVLDEYN